MTDFKNETFMGKILPETLSLDRSHILKLKILLIPEQLLVC